MGGTKPFRKVRSLSVPSVPEYMNVYDERKLVAEVQSGSREAFERLLDMHEDQVFNLVSRMVGSQDAEDVAQEALIHVYNSIESFQGKSSLSTWIHCVVVNVCREHRRKRRPETVSFEDDYPSNKADPNPDPAAAAVKNEVKCEVDRAIEALPEIHKDVVILHELQGLTYRECAAALGCPVGTVKSRLSNAFNKLRELLGDYVSESGLAK